MPGRAIVPSADVHFLNVALASTWRLPTTASGQACRIDWRRGRIDLMPNIASVLKAEVTRLARRELRQSIQGLRKAATAQRTELAALKRKVVDLEKQVKLLARATARASRERAASSASEANTDASRLRFRSAGMAANRKRLGLSAQEFGLLVGASGQAVYLWEQGKGKPRPQYLAAIAELRGMGKREVAARLGELKAAR